MKFKIIFSLDYEIHGNGDGSPYRLMVEPTYRLIKLLDKYEAKLTIFADVAEMLKFKEYRDQYGEDRFDYDKIIEQLQKAVEGGHDAQLHMHSSYFNSHFNGKKWVQSWDDYNLAALDYERINKYISQGKSLLEDEIRKTSPGYNCYAFRAANWSMVPTENIAKALLNNGIKIDSSVHKWGKQLSHVNYDYSGAHSHLIPYPASLKDINLKDPASPLLEIPIYTERRRMQDFITPIRMFRMIRARFHKHDEPALPKKPAAVPGKKQGMFSGIRQKINKKYPWKLDFNQAGGKQMIKAYERIKAYAADQNLEEVPVVLSGHSKTFIKYNELTLRRFLNHLNKDEQAEFAIYSDIKKELYL